MYIKTNTDFLLRDKASGQYVCVVDKEYVLLPQHSLKHPVRTGEPANNLRRRYVAGFLEDKKAGDLESVEIMVTTVVHYHLPPLAKVLKPANNE